MIASVWDWPSLKYAYFIIESERLDAGGWSPSRGIAAKDTSSGASDDVLPFDDILPKLPKDCFFAGVGDFCVGELFAKRDREPRDRIDLDRVLSEGTPQEVKVVELLRNSNASSLGSIRENSVNLGEPTQNTGLEEKTDTEYVETIITQPSDENLWKKIIPLVSSIGAGYLLYKRFESMKNSNLALRDILFAWGAGVTVGLTIGQEAVRQKIVRKKV
jgi:hypothetical protein